jgi:hypothetical protein
MKIQSFNPKFHPGAKVLVYIGGKYNNLVLTTVEYCKFCPTLEKWTYSLSGWGSDFEESDLQGFFMSEFSEGQKFTF